MPILKEYILYDFIYMKFLNENIDMENRIVFSGLKRSGAGEWVWL